uniref:Uncharacterized protein n=1 Tax=Rhizophora mucronata TaxID=61149 RepID=A0A2P2R4S8_RHIMU
MKTLASGQPGIEISLLELNYVPLNDYD